ncbi:tetratricopeptide repeat protein [Actinomadura litoris]|uniref:tetratricopeptide repeat protein n=1 Tax=Actinomadura litoris TaxID=2678616 RepID=UPI001FA6D2DB|nr:hypothetical protein [Actinomadura litoris]
MPTHRDALRLAAATALAVTVVVGADVTHYRTAPERRHVAVSSGAIVRYQSSLRRTPGDYRTWAALGAAYIERAEATVDPAFYPKAEEALRRSLSINGGANRPAMAAMASLADARHEYADAVGWGERGAAIGADVQGVLADAYTQLGAHRAAGAAVGRMGGSGTAFAARASREREMRGDDAGARAIAERVLETAATSSDVVCARSRLGDLALRSGDLDAADRHYRAALATDPAFVPARRGRARVHALRGDLESAADGYRDLVARVPRPRNLIEYIEVLRAAGHGSEAARQDGLLRAEWRSLAANGVVGDLEAAEYAADSGDAAGALRHARAEWSRRHAVTVADALAWALHLNGRDRQALRYERRAMRLGWRNALFYRHRADIRAALGDHAASARDRAAARRINPYLDLRFPAILRASLDPFGPQVAGDS